MMLALALNDPQQPGTPQVPDAYFTRPTNARVVNLTGLITPDDYPPDALAKQEEGTAEVILTVDAQGKLADCAIAVSAGSPALDLQTCRILARRGQFEAARDAQGRPVIGAIRKRIAWRMAARLNLLNAGSVITSDDYPLAALVLGLEGTVGLQMDVDPSGKVTNCAIGHSSGFTILDSRACRIFQERARFDPARDRAGRPVAGTTATWLSWQIAEDLPIIPWSFRLGVLQGPDGAQTKCSIEAGGALKRKRDSYVVPCADLEGGIVLPAELKRATLGKSMVLVFDRQFVPRAVHSIDTPPDLKRFTLLGREVAIMTIGGDGAVTGCRKTVSEGLFPPRPGACETFAQRRFTKPARTGTPLAATATVSVYSLPAH